MEYVREGYLKKDEMLCNRYGKAEWVGPTFSRIPSPYPDPDNAGHYHPISKTPRTINGKARAIEWSCPYGKYQKVVQGWIHLIKQLWVLKNFVLKRSMLLAIIVKHLEQLATVASIRERERRLNRTIEEGKQYQDYNWSDLIESGNLSKLKVNQSWTGTSRNTNFHLLVRNQTNWRGSPQISISEMTRRPPQKKSQLALRVILFGNLTRMTTMF